MKSVILSTLFFLLLSKTDGQKNLSKDEVLKYWIKTEKQSDNSSLINTGFDKVLDCKINSFLDSLRNKNVDSLIVYSSAYPGYSGYNKCDSGLFPMYTFIIWKIADETIIQKLQGGCNFNIAKLKSNELFEYFETNRTRLNKEFFIPVILGGEIDVNQKVSFSITFLDHEPNYCIFYSIGKDNKIVKFTESDIENKSSLFVEHNLKLAAFKWWKIIKKYTTDIKQW